MCNCNTTFVNQQLIKLFIVIVTVNDLLLFVVIHDQMDIFDAAERYKSTSTPVIILAGKEYGSGSSRDWAAKGPSLLVCFVLTGTFNKLKYFNS